MDEICPLGAAFCFHRLLLIYRQRNAAKADSAAAPRPTYTNSSTMGEGTGEIDDGHTAWILVSCALVNFMTPGLAFFYGGLVRRNHVLYNSSVWAAF